MSQIVQNFMIGQKKCGLLQLHDGARFWFAAAIVRSERSSLFHHAPIQVKGIFLNCIRYIPHSVITVTQIRYYSINPTKNNSLNSCNAHNKQCRRISEKKMLMCVVSNGNVWCNASRQRPCFHCFHDFGRPKVQDTPC